MHYFLFFFFLRRSANQATHFLVRDFVFVSNLGEWNSTTPSFIVDVASIILIICELNNQTFREGSYFIQEYMEIVLLDIIVNPLLAVLVLVVDFSVFLGIF